MSLPLYFSVAAFFWVTSLLLVWVDWHDEKDTGDLVSTALLFLLLSLGWVFVIPVVIAGAILFCAVRFVLFPLFDKLFASYLE